MDRIIKNEQLRNGLMKKKMEFDAAEKSGDREKSERLRSEITTQLATLNLSMKGMIEPMAMNNDIQREKEEEQLVERVLTNMGISEKETKVNQQDPTDQLVNKVFANLGIKSK